MIVWPRPSRPASRRQPYRPRRARAATRDARPGWPHDDVATLRRRASRRQPRFSILTDDHRLDGQFDRVNAAVVRASCCIALSLVERPVVRADAAQRGRAALLSGPRAGWRVRGPAAGRPRARPRGLRRRKRARSDVPCSHVPGHRNANRNIGAVAQARAPLEGASAGNQAHTGRRGRALWAALGTSPRGRGPPTSKGLSTPPHADNRNRGRRAAPESVRTVSAALDAANIGTPPGISAPGEHAGANPEGPPSRAAAWPSGPGGPPCPAGPALAATPGR